MNTSWHIHLVKCEHKACDNLSKLKSIDRRDMQVYVYYSFLLWWLDQLLWCSWELYFSCLLTHACACTHMHTHAHTQFRDCLWSPLQSIQPRHIPSHSNSSTYTHRRNCPLNYLVSLVQILQKERWEEEREKRKKKDLWEERDGSYIKMKPEEKNSYCCEKVEKEVNDNMWAKQMSRTYKAILGIFNIVIFPIFHEKIPLYW